MEVVIWQKLGEIYSSSETLHWMTGCRPYHAATRISRFALMCTARVTVREVMKIQSTINATSHSPKVPLQTRRASQLGKAYRLTQKGQHNTLWGWNCANWAVYTVSRFGKASKQKHQEQKSKLPLSKRDCCWQSPPVLYVHHTANRR